MATKKAPTGTPAPKKDRRTFTDADRERAFRQYMGGTTLRQISINMGCSFDTIKKWHKSRNWRIRKTEIENSIKDSMHSEEVAARLDGHRIVRCQQDLYAKLLERSQHLAETSQTMADVQTGIGLMKELLELGERIYGKLPRQAAGPNPQPQEQKRSQAMHTTGDADVLSQLRTTGLTPSPTPPIYSPAGGAVASAPAGDATPPPAQAEPGYTPAQAQPAQAEPPPARTGPIEIRQVTPGPIGQFAPADTIPDLELVDSDLTPEEMAARQESQRLLSQLPPGHPHRQQAQP